MIAEDARGNALVPALIPFSRPAHGVGAVEAGAPAQRAAGEGGIEREDGSLGRMRTGIGFPANSRSIWAGSRGHLARLVVDFLEGGNPLADLHSGAIDMAHVPSEAWRTERNLAGFTPFILPEPFGYLCVIYSFKNAAIAFIRDARVRRALTDAADQASMIALIYHGFSHENRIAVPVVPPTWLSAAAREGRLPVRSDKALARQELETAGWHVGPDGIRVQHGKRLEFTVFDIRRFPGAIGG